MHTHHAARARAPPARTYARTNRRRHHHHKHTDTNTQTQTPRHLVVLSRLSGPQERAAGGRKGKGK
eukprot:880275-Prorocentrum_lima.AAC.1